MEWYKKYILTSNIWINNVSQKLININTTTQQQQQEEQKDQQIIDTDIDIQHFDSIDFEVISSSVQLKKARLIPIDLKNANWGFDSLNSKFFFFRVKMRINC